MSASGDRTAGAADDPPVGQAVTPSTGPILDEAAGLPQGRALARIEQLITALVQAAPVAEPAVVDELVEHLRRVGSPLARSIARVVELVAEQLIAPGIALPPLAMACATLADGVCGKLTDRALEAARYEIETLLPVPDRPPAIAAPDVPLSALRLRGR